MPTGYSYLYKKTKGFEEHALSSMETITDVIQWGREKELCDPKAQLNKVIEEVGEVAHEICRNRIDGPNLMDGIGDVLVTVLILADICGMDPMQCLELAYSEIKDRKGLTSNGTFIKEDGGEADSNV